MNTNPRLLLATLVLALWTFPAHAGVPEPDNLLYGSITLDNVPVNAARTDAVIEARRTTNGPAIARYRMGSSPALGNLYLLRLQLESGTPLADPNASQRNDTVVIVVTDGSGLRAQTAYLIPERGVAQRVDFGAAVVDSDGDGLPDAWELQHFGRLNQSGDSPAANGQTVRQHYLAGTDPNDPDSGFKLHITSSNTVRQVSFAALRAEGPGYEGLTRRYTLEDKAALNPPAWGTVPGFVDVPGDNQTVRYLTADAGLAGFFRGRITLELSGAPASVADSDADGLPDDWERFHFGNLSQDSTSPGLNHQTAWQNYVAGTDPNDPQDRLQASLTRGIQSQRISFLSRRADGSGYAGVSRMYSLETSPNLSPDSWTAVPGFTFVSGDDQTHTHQSPATDSPAFYRVRVWLQP